MVGFDELHITSYRGEPLPSYLLQARTFSVQGVFPTNTEHPQFDYAASFFDGDNKKICTVSSNELNRIDPRMMSLAKCLVVADSTCLGQAKKLRNTLVYWEHEQAWVSFNKVPMPVKEILTIVKRPGLAKYDVHCKVFELSTRTGASPYVNDIGYRNFKVFPGKLEAHFPGILTKLAVLHELGLPGDECADIVFGTYPEVFTGQVAVTLPMESVL